MAKVTITFNKVVQDSQNYNSFDKDDDHMVSVIHFTLDVNDRQYQNMQVEIRQPYGTNYAEEPIEVGTIIGAYRGTWNHNKFADLCEEYYRSLIGPDGCAFNIQGVAELRMRDNSIIYRRRVEMDIPEDGATSW